VTHKKTINKMIYYKRHRARRGEPSCHSCHARGEISKRGKKRRGIASSRNSGGSKVSAKSIKNRRTVQGKLNSIPAKSAPGGGGGESLEKDDLVQAGKTTQKRLRKEGSMQTTHGRTEKRGSRRACGKNDGRRGVRVTGLEETDSGGIGGMGVKFPPDH